MSSIIMRAAMLASVQAQKEGSSFSPEAMAQVVTAALVGNGTSSFEAAVRWNIPFFTSDRPYPGVPMSREFPINAVIERARQILMRANDRQHRSDQNETHLIELEFRATRLASLAIDAIKATGLCLHTQKLLFSPQFSDHGLRVLKGLDQPGTKMNTASAAIAAGAIPAPPSRSLKEHFVTLGPKLTYEAGRPAFSDWIAAHKTVLVEFPLPDMKVGDTTRLDDYSSIGGVAGTPAFNTAQLGLGFCVIRFDRMPGTPSRPAGSAYFEVMTPLIFHDSRASMPWSSHNFLRTIVHEHHVNNQYGRLHDQLHRRGRVFVGNLQVCPQCREIYSADRLDLNQRCNCRAI